MQSGRFLLTLVGWASLLLATPAFANQVSLIRGQSYVYPGPVATAYVLTDGVLKLDQQGQQLTIHTQKKIGSVIVQVLTPAGKIDNLRVTVNLPPKVPFNSAYSNGSYLYNRGYNLIFRTYYSDTFRGGESVTPSRYGLNFFLNTQVKENGKFMARVEKRELYPWYFYVRGDYKQFYAGYGDLSLQTNRYRPSFINQPRLRQYTVGWDSEAFDLDLWSGHLSPVLSSRTTWRPLSTPLRQEFGNPSEAEFYGGRTAYYFGPKNRYSVFASYWKNSAATDGIPYLGAQWKSNTGETTISGTIGNRASAPVYGARYDYVANTQHNFGLQRLRVNYEVAPRGYENLLFSSPQPREELSVGLAFYSKQRYQAEGSIFLEPGYQYLLNAYQTSHSFNGTVGWQNRNVFFSLGGSYGKQIDNYAVTTTTTRDSLSPTIGIWLNDREATVRYRTELSQKFVNQERDGLPRLKQQETIWGLLGKGKNLSAQVKLSRVTTERLNATPVTGFRVNPSLTYSQKKFNAGVFANFIYNDQGLTNNYDVAQERYGATMGLGLGENHLISARASKVTDFRSSGYSSYMLSYTFKIGDPHQGVLSILDSRVLSGKVFEDLNFNGIHDAGEPGIPGIVVALDSLSHRPSATSDEDGDFKFRGLSPQLYTMNVNARALDRDYAILRQPAGFDFSDNSSHEVLIPVMETKNYEVEVVGDTGEAESIFLKLSCEKKGEDLVPVRVGTKGLVAAPVKDKCKLSLDLKSISGGGASSEELELGSETRLTLKVNIGKYFVGQLFFDKNNNGHYDFGEELAKAKVKFKEAEATTDANGIFSYKLPPGVHALTFDRVIGGRGYCEPRFPVPLMVFSMKTVQEVRCSVNKPKPKSRQ